MNVRIDSNGYPYDAETGNLVTIAYDEYSNAFDAVSGEAIDSIEYDSTGHTVYGHDPNLTQIVSQIAGSVFQPRGSQYPGGGINAGGTINRGGVSTGFNISTNTLMLIAGGVLIWILAQKKGR